MNQNRWTTTVIVEKLERDGYIQMKNNSEQAGNDGQTDQADDDKLPWKE